MVIPYSKQDINAADIKAVAKVLASPFVTQGPAISSFEEALARKVKATYCVAFNSGTAALHAAYFAAGIKKGDEVIVPALTFAATGNAALYLGAKPIFADIDPDYFTVDVTDVKRKITKRTKAIVSVDYGGRPADLSKLARLAKKRKLIFISDAAHSLGGEYQKRPVGSVADMTMFSFHPVKSITTGEGGAITTNSVHYYKQLLLFRSHGITKDPGVLSHDEGLWYQEMHALGFNYRITDIAAALGKSQLKRLDSFIAKRRTLAKRYLKLLGKVPNLILPKPERDYEHSAWHLFPIQVSAEKRKVIFESLRKEGIGVQVHYIPVYWHPYYQKLDYKKGLCPNAELFYQREVSIPLFPGLSRKEQDFVVKNVIAAMYD